MINHPSVSFTTDDAAALAADRSQLVSQPGVDELPVTPRASRHLADSIVASKVRLLTLKQVAELFGVSKLWFWRHRGDPHAVAAWRRWKSKESDSMARERHQGIPQQDEGCD